MCRQVRIRDIVDRLCPMKWFRNVSHGDIVEFLILHILQSYRREPLYQLQWWAEVHNVDRIYDCASQAFNDDRIARTLDAIAPHIADIETLVVRRALRHYHINPRTIHWDLTHLTFEGAYEQSDSIRPGYGHGVLHEHQLHISLHASSHGGIPLRHEVMPGNAHQAPRAKDMLQDLQKRLKLKGLIICADRAGISYEIINQYREAGAYFVAPLQATKAERKLLAQVPIEKFTELSYRSKSKPEHKFLYHETVLEMKRQKRKQPLRVPALFIHSTQKQEKDAKDRQKRIDKALERLQKIKDNLNKNRFARSQYVHGQLHKAVKPALHAIVRYELSGTDGNMALKFWTDEQALAQAAAEDGRYILLFQLPEPSSPEEAFLLFKCQPLIENRFRNFNSDLVVNPIWLHSEKRIKALILIFVLALIIYTLLELASERAGLETEYYHKMTTRAMMREFRYLDVEEVRIRDGPVQLEFDLSPEQAEILNALGLPEPSRYLH